MFNEDFLKNKDTNSIGFLGIIKPINRKDLGIRLYQMEENLDVLYVKPCIDHADFRIPMGLIGLMNSINAKKNGLYSTCLTDDIILNTKIIVMDLHWYWNMKPVYNISKKIKKLNPDIKIIIGGYTATIFADIIACDWDVDFVIKGDADKSFKLLIEAILDRRTFSIRSIPNLVSKNFTTPWKYTITQTDFNQIDFINIEWFPEYKDIIKNEELINKDTYSTYSSFLPIARGCHNSCETCYGSTKNFHKLTRNRQIIRKPEIIKNDLIRLSNDPNRRDISIISDFIDMYHKEIVDNNFLDKIFKENKYDLKIVFEFFNPPTINEIKLFQNSFKECWFTISLNKYHGQSLEYTDMNNLKEISDYINDQNNIHVVFFGNLIQKETKEILKKLPASNEKICYLDDSSWHLDIPWPTDDKKKMQKQYKKFFNVGIQYPDDSNILRQQLSEIEI